MSTFVGDVGIDFKIDSGRDIDITDATTVKIVFLKPDGKTGSWDAEVSGTHYVLYKTVEGDLDVAGTWSMQIYVVAPNFEIHGDIFTEFVEQHL